jgi:hypothetical protein
VSFFTTLTYYRPGRPPIVTGESLSRFIGRLIDTKLVEHFAFTSLKVKFGRAIDRDLRDAYWLEMLNPIISQSRQIDWDMDISAEGGFDTLLKPIANEHSTIYRAEVSIGGLVESVSSAISRQPSELNSIGFFPESLGLSIGPVRCSDLVSERSWLVGWIEMTFSGGGYLYPWTLRDVVKRAHDSAEITHLCDICRGTWPVPSRRPSILEVKRRKKFHRLWPYDDVKKPYDWFWSIHETG